MSRWELGAEPSLGGTEDLEQLRLANVELLKQLRVGQEAVHRSVAKAFAKSGLGSPRSCNSGTSMYPDSSLAFPSTSCSQDRGQEGDIEDTSGDDPCHRAWLGSTSSSVASLPPAKYQYSESLGIPASLPVPSELKESAPLAGSGILRPTKAWPPRSGRSKPSKPTVTFSQGPAVPERSWRPQPYLGCDCNAVSGLGPSAPGVLPTPESLDSTSPTTSESEGFFSTLQKFREANKEECIQGYTEQFQGLQGDSMDNDHHCVYCYRLNRRLFPVPVDPGAPCRLCGTPRDQRGPETLLEPALVRVSVPLSILDPPHKYHIHRRKSYDSSDTLALPRHCLLGWDSLPPKSERSSAPKSLDLWSSISSKGHHRTLSSATTPSCLVWTFRCPGREGSECREKTCKGPRPPPYHHLPCALHDNPGSKTQGAGAEAGDWAQPAPIQCPLTSPHSFLDPARPRLHSHLVRTLGTTGPLAKAGGGGHIHQVARPSPHRRHPPPPPRGLRMRRGSMIHL
ncbi:migration and invasion-inhibitory protein isoform 2-T4 [Thomomys bottae]